MAVIGFIGLGVMGSPMAANLAKAGFEVRGFRRNWVDDERLAGVARAASVREAVADADIVVTVLPDTPDVEAVLRSDDGVFQAASPGTLVVDMSTIDPVVSERLAAEAKTAGLRMIDAPVSGGEAGAIAGTLSIMVGGDPDDVAEARSLLDAMGKTIVHVGGTGRGQLVKAANQIVVAGNLQMLAEATTFLDAYDVDLEKALAVIGGGLAGSAALTQKKQNLLDRTFAPGFRASLHAKDLGIVTSAASAEKLSLPVTAVVTQLMRTLVRTGHGDEDHSALYRLCRELNGWD